MVDRIAADLDALAVVWALSQGDEDGALAVLRSGQAADHWQEAAAFLAGCLVWELRRVHDQGMVQRVIAQSRRLLLERERGPGPDDVFDT
jgi:hypothetical protein